MHALETGEFGADIATLLHQENLAALPQGTHALGSTAAPLFQQLTSIRPRLWAARATSIEKWLPEGMAAEALVKAVTHGTLTVHMLAGVAASATDEAVMAGLTRSMPLLVALLPVCTPRDASAVPTLLTVWCSASAATTTPSAGRAMLRTLFEAYVKRAAEHASGAAVRGPLSWAAVMRERDERAILDFQRGGGGSASTLQRAVDEAVRAASQRDEGKRNREAAAAAKAKREQEKAEVVAIAAAIEGAPAPASPGKGKK